MGPGPFAVRSSATREDRPDAAYAGQHETVLDVVGDEAILAAVRRSWASLGPTARWRTGDAGYLKVSALNPGDGDPGGTDGPPGGNESAGEGGGLWRQFGRYEVPHGGASRVGAAVSSGTVAALRGPGRKRVCPVALGRTPERSAGIWCPTASGTPGAGFSDRRADLGYQIASSVGRPNGVRGTRDVVFYPGASSGLCQAPVRGRPRPCRSAWGVFGRRRGVRRPVTAR